MAAGEFLTEPSYSWPHGNLGVWGTTIILQQIFSVQWLAGGLFAWRAQKKFRRVTD